MVVQGTTVLERCDLRSVLSSVRAVGSAAQYFVSFLLSVSCVRCNCWVVGSRKPAGVHSLLSEAVGTLVAGAVPARGPVVHGPLLI